LITFFQIIILIIYEGLFYWRRGVSERAKKLGWRVMGWEGYFVRKFFQNISKNWKRYHLYISINVFEIVKDKKKKKNTFWLLLSNLRLNGLCFWCTPLFHLSLEIDILKKNIKTTLKVEEKNANSNVKKEEALVLFEINKN